MPEQNQGKSYDKIADGFAEMRNSFNTEQKYLDALIEYLPKKSHIPVIPHPGTDFSSLNLFV